MKATSNRKAVFFRRFMLQVIHATGSGVASFAITADGQLLSWGQSKRGQLGLGHNCKDVREPRQVPGLKRVVQVSAGWGHAVALNGAPARASTALMTTHEFLKQSCYGKLKRAPAQRSAKIAWEDHCCM